MSWRVAIAAVGFCIGVWLVIYTSTIGTPFALCLLVAIVLQPRWLTFVSFVAAVSVGNWYGGIVQATQSAAFGLHGTFATIQGVVKEDPSLTDKGALTLQLHFLRVDHQTLEGTFWVSTTQQPLLRGDTIVVRGIVDEGFGTFVGMMKQATVVSVTRPVPGDVGRVVRDWFAAAIRQGIPEPQASLGIGFLTGQKSALPHDLAEALQIAGLSHIVVASGYNLTILVRLARRLFVNHSKYLSVTGSAGMIIGFVAMTGLSPSMTRAGLVSGLSLVTWAYGRSCHSLVILSLVAAITLVWQPSYAWGDMGWQLSFAAFFGVMIVAPLLQAYLFGNKAPGILRQVLGETVAAHIVTIPIVVAGFGVISHVAVIANLMIVPLVPLAMLLTFITGMVGLLAPAISELVGIPVTWLLTYMTTTAEYLAGLPWAQMEWHPPIWFWGLYCGGLFAAIYWMRRTTKLSLREVNPIL